MKRDSCHRFWVGSTGISASNYRLSRLSTGKPLPPAIGGEKKQIPWMSWSWAHWLGRVPAYPATPIMADALAYH
jgi:hypothetical protein